MSRRPSFQFYPADWFANPALKRCSHAEKGMWMDILCLLHDGDQYGVLRWPLVEIARAIGATTAAVTPLVRKGVLKGSDTRCEAFVFTPRSGRKDGKPVTLIEAQDGPVWFSSRMVTDEYKSNVRGGSSNTAPNTSPKVGIGEAIDTHPSRAAPSTSSSSAVEETGANAPDGAAVSPQPTATPLDLKAEMWRVAKAYLRNNTDMTDAAIGSLVGAWRRDFGDVAIINATAAAQAECASSPVEFIVGCLKRSKAGFAGSYQATQSSRREPPSMMQAVLDAARQQESTLE